MSIEVKVTQTCNICEVTRQLEPVSLRLLRVEEERDGWRELSPNHHACVTCIVAVLVGDITNPLVEAAVKGDRSYMGVVTCQNEL